MSDCHINSLSLENTVAFGRRWHEDAEWGGAAASAVVEGD